MPGYGFSGKPTTTGWGPERIARAWVVLMKRLGYSEVRGARRRLGRARRRPDGSCRRPPELLGILTNMAGTVHGQNRPGGASPEELRRRRLSLRRGEADVCAARLLLRKVDAGLRAARTRTALNAGAGSRVHRIGLRPRLDPRPRYGGAAGLASRVSLTSVEALTRDDVLKHHTLLADQHGVSSSRLLVGEQAGLLFAPKSRDHHRRRASSRTISPSAPPPGWAKAYPKLIQYRKRDRRRSACGRRSGRLHREDMHAGFRSLQIATRVVWASTRQALA